MMRIQEINFLRVFFMFMIFFHHFNYDYMGGDCAVAAFFIISGFCMTLGYGDKVTKAGFKWKEFMKKRMIKLYPLHIVAFILAWIGFGCPIPHNLWNTAKLCLNLALLQSWIPIKPIFYSYNAPSWYLCDILFFAAVFPFLFRLIKKTSVATKIILAVVAFALYFFLVGYLNEDMRLGLLYVNPIARLLDCTIGILLALLFLHLREQERYTNWIENHIHIISIAFWLFLGAVFLQSLYPLFFDKIYTAAYWPMEALLVLTLAILGGASSRNTVTKRLLNCKAFVFLGSCSLSFYLLHIPVINLMHLINENWYADSRNIVGAIVCLIVTLIVAIIANYLIEQKFTNWLKSKI